MKNKKLALDVDFIGSQESLTNEEEKALKDYFKERKLPSQNSKNRSKNSKHSKTTI